MTKPAGQASDGMPKTSVALQPQVIVRLPGPFLTLPVASALKLTHGRPLSSLLLIACTSPTDCIRAFCTVSGGIKATLRGILLPIKWRKKAPLLQSMVTPGHCDG